VAARRKAVSILVSVALATTTAACGHAGADSATSPSRKSGSEANPPKAAASAPGVGCGQCVQRLAHPSAPPASQKAPNSATPPTTAAATTAVRVLSVSPATLVTCDDLHHAIEISHTIGDQVNYGTSIATWQAANAWTVKGATDSVGTPLAADLKVINDAVSELANEMTPPSMSALYTASQEAIDTCTAADRWVDIPAVVPMTAAAVATTP
jgi:hypothetical protein